jgi:hypothetical protein
MDVLAVEECQGLMDEMDYPDTMVNPDLLVNKEHLDHSAHSAMLETLENADKTLRNQLDAQDPKELKDPAALKDRLVTVDMMADLEDLDRLDCPDHKVLVALKEAPDFMVKKGLKADQYMTMNTVIAQTAVELTLSLLVEATVLLDKKIKN